MKRALVCPEYCGVAVAAWLVLAVACGSRNGVDACASGTCARSDSAARGEGGGGGEGGEDGEGGRVAGGTPNSATGGSVLVGGTGAAVNTGGTTGGSGQSGMRCPINLPRSDSPNGACRVASS